MHFEKDDIPPGFGMLLGRNENAMKCFSGMTDTEKEDVIRQAQAARSTDDIAQIIECTVYWITILWIKIPAVADSSDLKRSPVECSPPG